MRVKIDKLYDIVKDKMPLMNLKLEKLEQSMKNFENLLINKK